MDEMNKYILSIDPSLSSTGYAVINYDTSELINVEKFTTSSKNSDDFRINEIVTKLFSVAATYPVTEVVLEDGFVGPSQRSSLQLATLRGAIIGVFQFNRYSVYHMQPASIRKALGCGGHAKKDEVAMAIINLYGPENKIIKRIGPYSDKQNKSKTSDMYDAIGIGLAYTKLFKKDGG